jgi:hypothetical protein
VPTITKAPLKPGFTVDIEWVALPASAGRLYRCIVEKVEGAMVTYRSGRNGPLRTIPDRVACPHYTGSWNGRADDVLGHTWPWVPVSAAQKLRDGEAGKTTVTLSDLLARQQRDYLLTGTRLVPCTSDSRPVLVPCWALQSGNGAALSVMSDPENPLTIESYEPGSALHRTLAIDGPEMQLSVGGL